MVTKKIAGAILSHLMREAQKVSRDAEAAEREAAEAGGAGAGGAASAENAYLGRMAEYDDFYGKVGALSSCRPLPASCPRLSVTMCGVRVAQVGELFSNYFNCFGEEEEAPPDAPGSG